MSDTGKTVTIVGGGLAGLTLGLGLRQRGVPVVVWEAGQYPRHRVCGEFISGRGQGVLRRLGVLPALRAAGATEARQAAFFFGASAAPARALSPPALCLSRYRLDGLLAQLFMDAGGELRSGQSWPGHSRDEGVVQTCGRRLTAAEGRWRWFGLKVHASGVPLSADLEMHLQRDGYVGICRLNETQVNVCGLFRQKVGAAKQPLSWRNRLRGHGRTPLAQRLEGAQFDADSFRAVAGLGLRPQRAVAQAECCLGDALTMIPPVTGNGMSMAFEAAELAVEPLGAWSRNELDWGEARQGIARACDERFASRLAWARWLQRLMFSPMLLGPVGALALRSRCVWRMWFAHTR